MLQSNSEIKAQINEFFYSIQGEGCYIGFPQFFIRFSECNLNCDYCDTKHQKINYYFSVEELLNKCTQNKTSLISLTGGEPLLQTDFLFKFLPALKKKKKTIFLETNGTLYKEFSRIIDFIDIISMDLKPEQANLKDQYIFADLSSRKELYFKVVISLNYSKHKYLSYIKAFSDFNKCSLILQPESSAIKDNAKFAMTIMNDIYEDFNNVRLIPQVHKWLKMK